MNGITLSLLVFVLLGAVDGKSYRLYRKRSPVAPDAECPRKPELATHRQCLKKCRTDLDCRGRNKRCLCDDVCGKSCVKPTLRCENLKPIFNGRYDLAPFNTFGAKARYACNEGYVLSGRPQRVCQGDGYWSGVPPTCQTEGTHAARVAPPAPAKEAAPAAVAAVTPFPLPRLPDEGKCRDPPSVEHAAHDGPMGQTVFPLGTQLTYACAAGYSIDGFFRAMCVGEGRWVGPRMTCSPRRCGHPGDIPHGTREGTIFVYPNKVKYSCTEGYVLVGRDHRLCQASGHWSGALPVCLPVKCRRLTAPANGQLHGDGDFTYGAVARFSCLRGFTLVGSEARTCTQDGTWSGHDATCPMVDCGLPGPFYNGYLDGQQTTFGAIIIFRCFGRTTFEGSSISTTCEENGEWSHPVPKCWSKCEVPPIENGTVLGYETGFYLNHDSPLQISCRAGFVQNNTEEPRCYNGTWTFVPHCIPAPCNKRPNDLRNGIVRFYTMDHGDRAKYKCNTGFKLVGLPYVTCQYGEWDNEDTHCEPVYCPYPGTIKNGQILLVGVIGKYEYRPYVRRIGHNEQIEFHCSKGYKRVGPMAATCVDGQWSPDNKPECIPGKHPKLMYIFRGKRSVRDLHTFIDGVGTNETADSPELVEQADSLVESTTPVNTLVDTDNKYERFDKGFCQVPNIDNGRIRNFRQGYFVYDGSELEVTCAKGFHLELDSENTRTPVCNNGVWSQSPPVCLPDNREICRFPGKIRNGQVFINGKIGKYEYRRYVRNIEVDTEIEFQCAKGYRRVGPAGATCRDGLWSPDSLPKCIPGLHPRIVYNRRKRRAIQDAALQEGTVEDNGSSNEISQSESSSAENSTSVPLLVDTSDMYAEFDRGFCQVPYIANGDIMNFPVGYYVYHGNQLQVRCWPGFHIDLDLYNQVKRAWCEDGVWTLLPHCLRDHSAGGRVWGLR